MCALDFTHRAFWGLDWKCIASKMDGMLLLAVGILLWSGMTWPNYRKREEHRALLPCSGKWGSCMLPPFQPHDFVTYYVRERQGSNRCSFRKRTATRLHFSRELFSERGSEDCRSDHQALRWESIGKRWCIVSETTWQDPRGKPLDLHKEGWTSWT